MSSEFCYGCFAPFDSQDRCGQCGFVRDARRSGLFLPLGAELASQYVVGRILGEPGGFGITYLGWDRKLQVRVAIKEFLPKTIAGRDGDGLTVSPHTARDRESFENGRTKFLAEARTIAQFRHPNVVTIRQFFEENNTAYMVMDYYEGQTLSEYLSYTEPKMPAGAAIALICPILEGLHTVHDRGVLHRDVKPANIYLASIGQPILIDFSAAREATGFQSQSLSVVLTEGYAPIEQYQRKGNQGPWTDVYGAAATLYRMMAGEPPMIAMDRISSDPLRDMRSIFPDAKPVADALSRALAVRPSDRTPSAAVFSQQLQAARARLETGDNSEDVEVTSRFLGMRRPGGEFTDPPSGVVTLPSEQITPHRSGLAWVPVLSLIIAILIVLLVLGGLPDTDEVVLPPATETSEP